MNKYKLVKKVIAKLEDRHTLSKEETMEIIYSLVDKFELMKPNYKKNIILDDFQMKDLRKIYEKGPVKKLYSYSTKRFGFKLDNMRVDVEPYSAQIVKP